MKGDRQGDSTPPWPSPVPAPTPTLAARIEPRRDEIRIALQRFDGRYQGIPVALAAPTRLRIVGAQVRIEPDDAAPGRRPAFGSAAWSIPQTAISASISPACRSALVDTFAPGTGLDGTLQAKAQVTGPMANPRIQATYTATGVRLKRPETALLPALGVQGTASMAASQPRSMRACRPARAPTSHQGQGRAGGTAARSRSPARSISRRSRRRSASGAQRHRHRAARSHVQHRRHEDHRHRARSRSPTRALASRERPAAERRRGRVVAAGRHAAIQRLLPDRPQRHAFRRHRHGAARSGAGLPGRSRRRRPAGAASVSRADLVATVSSDLKITARRSAASTSPGRSPSIAPRSPIGGVAGRAAFRPSPCARSTAGANPSATGRRRRRRRRSAASRRPRTACGSRSTCRRRRPCSCAAAASMPRSAASSR